LDPAAVVMVGWGLFSSKSGRRSEGVVVSFYGKSQAADVAHGVQDVSGLPIVLFTTAGYYPKFHGKVLDHTVEGGFLLRDP
jgi:hypothetical protein